MCHDEFDAICEDHKLHNLVSVEEQEVKARNLKQRTLGIFRLIAELYKKAILPEKIMLQIVSDLFWEESASPKTVPHEDFLEALCDLFMAAGKHMKETASELSYKKLSGVLNWLTELRENQQVSSRTRFMIRNVIELRSNNWQPRHLMTQAKKLEEIRVEAEQYPDIAFSGTVHTVLKSDESYLSPQLRFEREKDAGAGLRNPVRDGEFSSCA